MSLRCLNCGETGLRDKAEYCDNCGAELVVKLDDSIPMLGVDANITDQPSLDPEPSLDAGTTGYLPEAIAVEEEEGATTFISGDQAGPDEEDALDAGATGYLPEAIAVEEEEGATTFISGDQAGPDEEDALDAGATGYLPEAIAVEEEEGATTFISGDQAGPDEEDALDAGATGYLPEATAADDGGTSVLAVSDGLATFLSSTEAVENDGVTSFIDPNGEGVTAQAATDDTQAPDDGRTGFLSRDEGGTALLSVEDDLEAEGLTQAVVSSQIVDRRPSRVALETTPQELGTTNLRSKDTKRQEQTLQPGSASDTLEGSLGQAPTEDNPLDDGSTQYLETLETHESIVAQDTASPRPSNRADELSDTDFSTKHVLRILDRYQLSEILGKGGFGAAYLAEDIKLRRRCVVKQMLTLGKSPKEIAVHRTNFEREAKLLVELNDPGHPNIPEIYDYFSLDSGNYLVMKFIEGQNLKDSLNRSETKKLPWKEAGRYAVDVCSALHYMHNHGDEPVMHRDVKPANIQLGDDGRVWLVDFGLAKADPVEDSDDYLVTQASGSFGYTPLEQWFGQAIPASDIYALGATLHHLVTGLDPLDAFDGEFHIQKIQELHGELPLIRTIDPTLPERLEQIIEQAIAPDPEQRPTALQLQQQLEAVISGAKIVTLYTFKNGRSAETVNQLVDLCESNRREAEGYLYSGAFERWFLLINRNDLAEAAAQAVKQGKNQRDGLEKFLKLIMPNILRRRLRRAGRHMVRGTVQFILIAIFVVLLLGVGGSYVAGLVIRQSIDSVAWDFYALDLEQENRYDEAFLRQVFRGAAGAYLKNLQVQIKGPDKMNIIGQWDTIPLDISTSLRMSEKNPRINLESINGIPLFIIGSNISQGINHGIDDAFQKAPVDVSRLVVVDGKILFKIKRATEVGRPLYGTPTPAPTPTPTPRPTPTPVNVTLVVVFNDSNEPVTLEIEELGRSWNIGARDTEVLETPPGVYNYTVKYQGTDVVAAQGQKEWILNKAYRLRINLTDE